MSAVDVATVDAFQLQKAILAAIPEGTDVVVLMAALCSVAVIACKVYDVSIDTFCDGVKHTALDEKSN